MQVLSQSQSQSNSNTAKILIGLASAAVLIASTRKSNEKDSMSRKVLNQMFPSSLLSGSLSECVGFNDKHLSACMDKVEKGIEKLGESIPGFKRPELKCGLRGTRYFIEFPIVGRNVDVFSIILQTEKLIR